MRLGATFLLHIPPVHCHCVFTLHLHSHFTKMHPPFPLQTETRNSLTCAICIDVITDLDEWLTSDKTEQEIIDFVEQVNTKILPS